MSISRRVPLAVAASAALLLAGAVVVPVAAGADGPTSFSNSTAIAIPSASSTDQSGPANPYPSSISVSGMTGDVTNVTATFNGLSHTSAGDIDAMLVSPSGANLILMSDVGDQTSFTYANNATLIFSDSGGSMPSSGAISSGTYKPTNINVGGTSDTFPSPAPTPSSETTLAAAFTGIDPNGTWSLYVDDDNTGDTGTMSGGWSLSITTSSVAAATSTQVVASPNPATTGTSVDLTATVTSSGAPVTEGTVTFTDGSGGPVIASGVALDGSGQADTSTSSLTEGTHTIVATYSGTSNFLTSNGSTAEEVDNATTVNGTTFCNTGPITIPTVGQATPYASHITVSGLAVAPLTVTPSVSGLAHTFPPDIDMMLVGPRGQNLELMSDVGGTSPVTGVDLTFSDGAPSIPSSSLSSGTYAPTNDTTDGPDSFPAPAPTPSGATALATFANVRANGTWSLYIVDDADGDSGQIAGGWCVSFAMPGVTDTGLTVQPGVAEPSGTTTLTATVTSGGSPVTEGDVDFYDVTGGGNTLLGSVPVDGTGTAVYDAGFPAGRHVVQARYPRNADYGASHSARLPAAVRPVADPGGPYTISPGNDLDLDASGSTVDGTSQFRWDLNRDGTFDVTGESPTVTWSQLQALGYSAGHKYHISVQVRTDGVYNRGGTTVTVTS